MGTENTVPIVAFTRKNGKKDFLFIDYNKSKEKAS